MRGRLDLRGFNQLQDTTGVVFTKQYGFRFSSISRCDCFVNRRTVLTAKASDNHATPQQHPTTAL